MRILLNFRGEARVTKYLTRRGQICVILETVEARMRSQQFSPRNDSFEDDPNLPRLALKPCLNPPKEGEDFVSQAKRVMGFRTENTKAEAIFVPAPYKSPRWQEPCTDELIIVFLDRFPFENVRK